MPPYDPEPPRGAPRTGGAEQGGNLGDVPGMLRGFGRSVAAYLDARLRLAGIEGKEAAGLAAKSGALVASGAGLLFLGYALVVAGAVGLLSGLLGWRWEFVALALASLHAAAGWLILRSGLRAFGKPMFEASLQEFENDRRWLEGTKPPRRRG